MGIPMWTIPDEDESVPSEEAQPSILDLAVGPPTMHRAHSVRGRRSNVEATRQSIRRRYLQASRDAMTPTEPTVMWGSLPRGLQPFVRPDEVQSPRPPIHARSVMTGRSTTSSRPQNLPVTASSRRLSRHRGSVRAVEIRQGRSDYIVYHVDAIPQESPSEDSEDSDESLPDLVVGVPDSVERGIVSSFSHRRERNNDGSFVCDMDVNDDELEDTDTDEVRETTIALRRTLARQPDDEWWRRNGNSRSSMVPSHQQR